ncbi:MAG: creatininase family protein [Acidimicrobiales bacterium]
MARHLGDLSAPVAQDQITASTVIVQPIGAIEQHGPHLPLATDAIMAESIVEAVIDDRPDLDLWGLPTLAYGTSTEHIWAPGTITLSTATLLAVLDDVARSVATLGGRRLAIVNGHGGNTHLLQVACRDLRVRYGLLTFLLHPSIPPDHGGPAGDPREEDLGVHGGMGETSMMMHLRPDLVDLTLAPRNVPSWLRTYEHVTFGGGVDFGWTSEDFGSIGVIGDPTLADADNGKRLFEAAVARMGEAFAEVARFDFPDGPDHSPTQVTT